MKICKLALCALTAGALLASCTKQDEGGVRFCVSQDLSLLEATRSQVSDYTGLPSSGDFDIVLTGSSGDEIYSGPLSLYDESTPLKAGNYSVKATYGSASSEGFDKPFFEGEKNFSITGGGTTAVSIPASLSNAIIKVSCSDLFKTYYPSYSFTVTTGGGTRIEFGKDETRAAFVDAYTISVAGTLTNQGGKEQTFSKDYKSYLAPKTCYTLKFDLSNVGGGRITVKFDDTVDDVQLSDVELND